MKLEYSKTYVDALGNEHGSMVSNKAYLDYPFLANNTGLSFSLLGTYLCDNPHNYDIVEELSEHVNRDQAEFNKGVKAAVLWLVENQYDYTPAALAETMLKEVKK